MDPWLLQALADMTPEEYAEALRTGQFTPQKRLPWPVLEGEIMPSAPKPVRPGLPSGAPGLPSGAPQLGPGLPGLPAGGAQAALPRGAIPQPPGAFAGAPPAAPQYPPISLSSIREGATAGAEQFGNMQTAVRQAPVPGSPQFAAASTQVQPQAPSPLRVPIPRAGAQPIPFTPGPSMTDPGLSAVRPRPWGIEDLLQADRPPPPLRSLPIPELPGEPLPTPRGPGAPAPSAPIAAAGAPVRPAVPAPAAPAAPSSMPRLPGMEGISQVDGAFGAGQSAQADAFRQYLAGKGGQPGLAGAASGAGMGSPVPPPAGSVPGAGAGMPPPPPPPTGAGASPGAGVPGGQRLSQADEAMLRMRAAAADSKQFATKPVNPLASGAKAIGGKLLRGAGALGMGYTGYKVLEGAADAYDPNAGMLENAGNVIGGGAKAAWELRPTPMNMAFGGGTAEMNDPNFKMGGIVGAGMAIKDYLDQRGQPQPFTDAQPGTAAAIRAAMDSGQSRAPAFDMSNPKPADPGATPPAAGPGPGPVRPRTAGGGGKRPQAPAIPPPSGETGVSGGSPGAGPGPYKLLGQDLQLTDTGSGISAVRPGGAVGASSSPSPTGSWRDKGYTAMLNDKRGVMGEGRRMPLGAGPGEGARYGLDTEMKGNLASSVRPSTGLNLRNAVPEYLEPEGEVPETEEDKQARLAAAKAKVSPIFAGLAPYSR